MTENYPLELDMLLLIIVLLPCFITLDEAGDKYISVHHSTKHFNRSHFHKIMCKDNESTDS